MSKPISDEQLAELNAAHAAKRATTQAAERAGERLNQLIVRLVETGVSRYRVAQILGIERSHVGRIVKAASAAKEKEV